jgi:hypothetical protein
MTLARMALMGLPCRGSDRRQVIRPAVRADRQIHKHTATGGRSSGQQCGQTDRYTGTRRPEAARRGVLHRMDGRVRLRDRQAGKQIGRQLTQPGRQRGQVVVGEIQKRQLQVAQPLREGGGGTMAVDRHRMSVYKASHPMQQERLCQMAVAQGALTTTCLGAAPSLG